MRRPFVLAACRVLVLGPLVAAAAAGESSLPAPRAGDAERVFVAEGIGDDFKVTRTAIAEAEQAGERIYRVAVVDSAEPAEVILPELIDRWWKARREGSGFDPARDVTILLNVGDRSLAMDVPHGVLETAGVDLEVLERELILRSFVPRAKDLQYAAGLASLVTDAEALFVQRRQARERAAQEAAAARIRREQATRTFLTRTLPIAATATTAAGLLGWLVVRRVRHASRLRFARDRLAVFKEEVVALSDMLDAQRERHRMLPHADPDFQTPMDGMTRAAYESVQAALPRYRERWLGLMDVWERAQQRIGDEWFLGTAASDEVIALLDAADARPPLDEVAAACRAPLDSLEQAHERARELAQELDGELVRARTRLDGLAGRGRSAAPFEPTLATATRERTLAGEDLERDPVAARGRLEEARTALAEMTEAIDGVEAADDRRRQAAARAAEVARRVAARRAEGWLLDEPGANPDVPLEAAAHEAELAARLLDSADVAAALGQLAAAEASAAEAVALLESVVAARKRSEELLPGVAARLEEIVASLPQGRGDLEHLLAAYAPAAIADVSDNLTKAMQGLDRARILVAEARVAAEPARQHHLRAVAVLEEAGRQEEWSRGCVVAIGERRRELDGLMAALPAQRDRVRDRVAALARGLERQRTDRVRANERCQEAVRLLAAASGLLEERRPDPRRAEQAVQAAETAAARGEELAAEDDRLAAQAVADLEEADATVRRVAGWYDEGVQVEIATARVSLAAARSLLERQRYEESIHAAAEASQEARLAYAAAAAEAARRRAARQEERRRRQLEESFSRMSRGSGPWVISLPTGPLAGPDPWRTIGQVVGGATAVRRSAGGGWDRDVAKVRW